MEQETKYMQDITDYKLNLSKMMVSLYEKWEDEVIETDVKERLREGLKEHRRRVADCKTKLQLLELVTKLMRKDEA